jgi:hypothetical protein
MLTTASPTTPRPRRSGHWNRRFLLIATVLTLAVSACATPPPGKSVALGEQVNLAIGQTVTMVGESLRITFVEVTGDSRCPRGATCVWQGEAICRLKMVFQGSETTVTVKEPGLTEAPGVADFDNYAIQFRLRPYPDVGKETKPGDYRLELTVRRAP